MTPPERLRLLLVSGSEGRIGAPERVLWELATHLHESRWAIAAWLPPDPSLDELAESLEERGVRVERLGEPRSRWDLRGLAAETSLLRRVRPAILHLHAGPGPSHRGLPALARVAGVPNVVVTQHGRTTEHWRGLGRADAVTAVCEALADGLVSGHGLPRSRVRVVPHGAEVPDEVAELPAARRLRDRLGVGVYKPLWVCAGRLEPSKGHEILIESLRRLAQTGLDFAAAVAGEGSQRSLLERRVAELGLGARIHFLGAVESLGPVLLAADVVVLPSLGDDLPLSVLEAMARGRAVVASEVGGLPDLIADGVRGLLVPPGDAEALAGALARLHPDAELRRRLGQQAAEHVRRSFTWAHVVERYEAVYDDVLGLAGFAPELGSSRRPGAG
jgi:glycosyltransferase involved in cell wall biosynthesis